MPGNPRPLSIMTWFVLKIRTPNACTHRRANHTLLHLSSLTLMYRYLSRHQWWLVSFFVYFVFVKLINDSLSITPSSFPNRKSFWLSLMKWNYWSENEAELGIRSVYMYLKRETCTRLEGHHIAAGSTRYRRNIPAQPNPSTCVHTITYMTDDDGEASHGTQHEANQTLNALSVQRRVTPPRRACVRGRRRGERVPGWWGRRGGRRRRWCSCRRRRGRRWWRGWRRRCRRRSWRRWWWARAPSRWRGPGWVRTPSACPGGRRAPAAPPPWGGPAAPPRSAPRWPWWSAAPCGTRRTGSGTTAARTTPCPAPTSGTSAPASSGRPPPAPSAPPARSASSLPPTTTSRRSSARRPPASCATSMSSLPPLHHHHH